MNLSEYYLNENFFIKLIEFPALYNIKTDEIYCLDEKALKFLSTILTQNKAKQKAEDKGSMMNLFDDTLTHKPSQFDNETEFNDLMQFCLNEGILTYIPRRKPHPTIKKSPLPSLRYLELQITKRCNLQCKHCFVDKSSKIDLSFEKIARVLKEFEDMQGLRVLITGGEPLLHPEFDRINNFLPELGLRKILFTNGVLLNDKWLKKLNVQEIQISLDGMKQGHENLRGKNTFNKTISAIKKAIEHGFDVSVATVIHRKNLNEFEKLEELVKNLKVRDWTVDALTFSGNLKSNKEFWVEPEIAGKIMKRYSFSKEEHPRAEGYGCGAHLLAILANGQSAFCSFFEESPLGHINEGLEVLWQRKKQVFLKDLECSLENCPYLNECTGGCRYRAIALSGKPNSKDLFKCYQMFSDDS